MTANIVCYAPMQGLATSLDTLCAQAYGSGHKHLVGLQLQRMTYFLWLLTLPIAVVFYFAGSILKLIVPEPESAELAGPFPKNLKKLKYLLTVKRSLLARNHRGHPRVRGLRGRQALRAVPGSLYRHYLRPPDRCAPQHPGELDVRVALRLGLHRRADRGRVHPVPDAHPTIFLRRFRRWFAVLGGIQQTRALQLG